MAADAAVAVATLRTLAYIIRRDTGVYSGPVPAAHDSNSIQSLDSILIPSYHSERTFRIDTCTGLGLCVTDALV